MPQRAFEAMARGGSLAHVAKELGVSRRVLYFWMEQYPEFAEAIDRATPQAEVLWLEHKHSAMGPAAWIFCMKNLFKWKDTVGHELTGKDGGAIQVTALSPDRLKIIAREYLLAADKGDGAE